MRETNFIRQNKEKWGEFENILQQDKKDPDKLSSLFMQVTDDLSYSRTFYPNRYVRVYLNNLAQRVFLSIYKNKKSRRGRLWMFWKEELPLLLYDCRKELLWSFIIFIASVAIGVFSSIYDPDFARLILGDSYVNMTEAYINEGDPMKVYKTHSGTDMFLYITYNNLIVAFITYLLGLLFAVGTIARLLYNGIMIGAFQYFFIERGLFRESFLTIWMHGTLEISSFVIAGTAGLVLGKGLVFPGTYTRWQALQLSARRSLKIMMALVPIFIIAAIIESWFTRHTEAPDAARLAVILLSLFFILAYFVWYPFQKARKNAIPLEVKLPEINEPVIDLTSVRTNGEIFGDIFFFFRKYFWKILLMATLIGGSLSAIYWLFNPAQWREAELFSEWGFFAGIGAAIFTLDEYFRYTSSVLIYIMNSVAFGLNATIILWLIRKKYEGQNPQLKRRSLFSFSLRNLYKALIVSFLINLILFLPTGFAIVALWLLLPPSLTWLAMMMMEEWNPIKALGKMDSYIGQHWGRMIALFTMILLLCIILTFFIDSGMVGSILEVLKWNIILEQDTVNKVYAITMRTTNLIAIHLLLPLALAGLGLQYFSLKEIREANYLKKRIEFLGTKNFNG